MRETACEPKWRQWISEIRRYCNLGGDNFDVSAYYDLLAPLSAHIDVWETNYYHALPGMRRSSTGIAVPVCARIWPSCPMTAYICEF